MFKIDPEYFYTIEELEKNQICSKSSLYRRLKAKQLKASKSVNGETVIKGDEILNYLKKHPAAS